MVDKIMTAQQAVKKYVNNSDMVFVGGFGHAIPFSVVQEIVRQKKHGLHLIKTGADIVFDMLVAGGCAQGLTCGWYGNPGIGMSNVIRNAVESGTLELTESTNFSMMLRLHAGKLGVPFIPSPILSDGDLAHTVSEIKSIKCPFTDTELQAHGSLNPDVAVVHAQRSDINGNVQLWGSIGDTVDGCEASKKIICSVEEICREDEISLTPHLTKLPAHKVVAVIKQPFGAYPSYLHSFYQRDEKYYANHSNNTKDALKTKEWLQSTIYNHNDFNSYLHSLPDDLLKKLEWDNS
jgi:glutaconate CoA-transferase subunit A|tara:strand:+ start:166 stop:1041 length:876 start_codon:yes stop_codon:yes gene_type:complete